MRVARPARQTVRSTSVVECAAPQIWWCCRKQRVRGGTCRLCPALRPAVHLPVRVPANQPAPSPAANPSQWCGVGVGCGGVGWGVWWGWGGVVGWVGVWGWGWCGVVATTPRSSDTAMSAARRVTFQAYACHPRR